MIILGISGRGHDAASAIIVDGKIIAACEEERFCRIKHAPKHMPIKSAKECMKIANKKPENIDFVTYYFNPERYNKDIIPYILKNHKQFLKNPKKNNLIGVLSRGRKHKKYAEETVAKLSINKNKLKFVDHHLAHMGCSYLLSNFNESMILSIDNMGELSSTVLAVGKGGEIKIIKEQNAPHSLGVLYATATDYLGFKPFSEEGKVMGLASYGKPIIPVKKIVDIKNGNFLIKEPFLCNEINSKKYFSKGLEKKYGKPRDPKKEITEFHKNFAASIQNAVEQVTIELVKWIHKKTGLKNICIGGGVALNCSLNGKIENLNFIQEVHIFSASGDNGTSLGSAVYFYVKRMGKRPTFKNQAGLGSFFSKKEIETELKNKGYKYKLCKNIPYEAAKILLDEKVLCWYQGRAEFGPRSLGHRSILALPNSVKLKNHINKNIKIREMWRPLCPSILNTKTYKYSKNKNSAKHNYMIVTSKATNYAKKRIPGVIHIDGTIRIQSVTKSECLKYYNLLLEIEKKTGDGVVLNTSFNYKGEPMVNSPKDALNTFEIMPINTLIIGDFIVQKNL